MKQVVILLFFCLVQTESYAQNEKITTATIDSLYVKALNNRFDLTLSSGYISLEPTAESKRIKNKQVSNRYKFPSSEELKIRALQEKKTIGLIRLGHKIISNDTIDINLTNVGYTAEQIKHSNGIVVSNEIFAISCGGTKGYQPSMRFVYDKIKNDWILIYNSSTETEN
ncbi:MAG: hypothetical protein AB8B65_04360 [Kordia sp.]|uniref:hypothetical protein n=1 Tax=Kordia sp. TaxID=1965332 RepID=UPI00385A6DB3